MQAIKFCLTKNEHDIVTCPARFMGVFAGRRWGKTLSWRYRMLRRIAEGPRRLAYIVPSYSQLRSEYNRLIYHPAVRTILDMERCGVQPYPHLAFTTGAELQLRSFDRPQNVRSQGLDEVWVDEIQDIREAQFWLVIRPLISDRAGNLIVSGQFRGENWFYKEFFQRGQSGKDSRRPLYWSWRFPSSTGLAFRGPRGREELAIVRSQVPAAVWDQEYECLPSANINKVFRCVARCIGGAPQSKPLPGQSYILAWDTGKVVDPSALLILAALSGVIVHCEILPLGMEFTDQLARVAQLARLYNNAAVVMDITGAGTQDRLLDFARAKIRNIAGLIFSRSEKEQLIREVAVSLEQRRLTIPAEFPELQRQLERYEYEYRSNRIEYKAPAGEHDDLVAALCLACGARLRNWHANPAGLPLGIAIN